MYPDPRTPPQVPSRPPDPAPSSIPTRDPFPVPVPAPAPSSVPTPTPPARPRPVPSALSGFGFQRHVTRAHRVPNLPPRAAPSRTLFGHRHRPPGLTFRGAAGHEQTGRPAREPLGRHGAGSALGLRVRGGWARPGGRGSRAAPAGGGAGLGWGWAPARLYPVRVDYPNPNPNPKPSTRPLAPCCQYGGPNKPLLLPGEPSWLGTAKVRASVGPTPSKPLASAGRGDSRL